MKKIILVILLSVGIAKAGEVGNEIIGSNGRPTSTSLPVCILRVTADKYLEILESKNTPINEALALLKKVYSPLYYQVIEVTKKIRVCETDQDITPDLFPHEYVKDRVSLWIKNGDIDRDLILIDRKKYYAQAFLPSDRAFVIVKELLHPVLRGDYSYNSNHADWINKNITYVLSQAFVKYMQNTLSEAEIVNIRILMKDYGLIRKQNDSDSHFHSNCKVLVRCQEWKESLEGIYDFKMVLDGIVFTLKNLAPDFLSFFLENMTMKKLDQLVKYNEIFFDTKNVEMLEQYIQILKKYSVLEKLKARLAESIKINYDDAESPEVIKEYFAMIDMAEVNNITISQEERVKALTYPFYFSSEVKKYTENILMPNLDFLKERGVVLQEISNLFLKKSLIGTYIDRSTQEEFESFVDGTANLIKYQNNWNSHVDEFYYTDYPYTEERALKWAYLIKRDLLTKEKLGKTERRKVSRGLLKYESTKPYAKKIR